MLRVALDTLGCKLNQAETEMLARQFAEAGYILVSPRETADVYILNTCTVTHIADAKSRHWFRLAHRRNPDALVVATGCYAQRVPEELTRIEGVGLVVGNENKLEMVRLLEESGYLSPSASLEDNIGTGHSPLSKTRAFTKIQDGCDNFCAYCIVPLVRDRIISLSIEQVVSEVRQRVADGYKEIVLTGTRVGAYNHDGVNLKGLLESILAETDVTRLRLSSLQPHEISPELIGLWSDSRLCPHFHLSLQSGNDDVLQRMNRHYCVDDYQRTVSLIRRLLPQAAITTDVIVGFPGETEEEFAESYEFCRQLGFARIHVFPYSPRSGTEAARFPHQIGSRVKKERSQKMLALAGESTRNFNEQFLGKVMPVLWEKRARGFWSGLTDNYIKVYIMNNENLTNRLLPVRLVEIKEDGMRGEMHGFDAVNLANKTGK